MLLGQREADAHQTALACLLARRLLSEYLHREEERQYLMRAAAYEASHLRRLEVIVVFGEDAKHTISRYPFVEGAQTTHAALFV
jgi:hypothetical protein